MSNTSHEWLLISHPTVPSLSVIDADSLELVTSIAMPGRIAVLDKSSSGRYAFVNHRDDHLVSIIRCGEPPALLRTVAVGQEPTHFHAHEDQIVIFNDGSGSITIFDETQLEQAAEPETIAVTKPDHGSAVVLDDLILAGFLRLAQVDVYRRDGTGLVTSFDGCTALHGATQIGNAALFGCTHHVAVIKRDGDSLRVVRVNNVPESLPRERVGVFATHPRQSVAIGNLGHRLAIIDPQAETMEAVALPAAPLKFAFDSIGQDVLALTADGYLHQIDLHSKQINRSVRVTPEAPEPKGPGGPPRPSFCVGNASIYVVSPDERRLIEVSLAAFNIRRTIDLPESPVGIVSIHA